MPSEDITAQIEAVIARTSAGGCKHDKARYWRMDDGSIAIEYAWGELESVTTDGTVVPDEEV